MASYKVLLLVLLLAVKSGRGQEEVDFPSFLCHDNNVNEPSTSAVSDVLSKEEDGEDYEVELDPGEEVSWTKRS